LGPSTILFIGILSSLESSPATIYSSMLIGGLLMAFLSLTGLFGRLRSLFTPRVVSVILLLVAFTILPTITKLVIGGTEGPSPGLRLIFAFIFMILMFIGGRYLKGLLKNTLVLAAMALGSLAYFLIDPGWAAHVSVGNISPVSLFFSGLNTSLAIEPGVLVAFVLCFLGLSINDLGSIQAVGLVLKADEMPRRITRGITATGIGNVMAGFMGVIGPVNFSFSPGLIVATGCAARRSLIPAGVAMLVLAFLPQVIFYLSFIPAVVIGCVLFYTMCTQVAAGLMTAFDALKELGEPRFDNALLISLPILMGVIVSFLPQEITASYPYSLRPILSNGFVVGIVTSLVLEHTIGRPTRDL
ncbi:MAG TPA: solute carrier family 23 protein, partial [Syntrophomonas sp.]|nr:solute carrier family 23 protein [Syntrophomonas sp.]